MVVVEVRFVWEGGRSFHVLGASAFGETGLIQLFLYVRGDVRGELKRGVVSVVVVLA